MAKGLHGSAKAKKETAEAPQKLSAAEKKAQKLAEKAPKTPFEPTGVFEQEPGKELTTADHRRIAAESAEQEAEEKAMEAAKAETERIEAELPPPGELIFSKRNERSEDGDKVTSECIVTVVKPDGEFSELPFSDEVLADAFISQATEELKKRREEWEEARLVKQHTPLAMTPEQTAPTKDQVSQPAPKTPQTAEQKALQTAQLTKQEIEDEEARKSVAAMKEKNDAAINEMKANKAIQDGMNQMAHKLNSKGEFVLQVPGQKDFLHVIPELAEMVIEWLAGRAVGAWRVDDQGHIRIVTGDDGKKAEFWLDQVGNAIQKVQ